MQRWEKSTCACSDIWCDKINGFLRIVPKVNKCSYKRPKQYGTLTKFPHKRKRSEMIHKRIISWRKQVDTKSCKHEHHSNSPCTYTINPNVYLLSFSLSCISNSFSLSPIIIFLYSLTYSIINSK